MKLLLMLLAVLCLFQGISPNAEDLSHEADLAYANGDFQSAAKLYQQMIDAGVRNTVIYFNLGNTYYQLHDLGRSLLNYRRAAQFIPRDEDLRLNIARIRAQRVDASNSYVAVGDQIAQWANSWFSISESGQLILALWWISCGFLSAYILLKRWQRWTKWGATISLVVFVFVGVVTGIRVAIDNTYPSAVIISPATSVLTGPDTKYMQIFELHAAGEVRIMERQKDWVRVQIPDLQEGWIKEDSIEVI